MFFLGTCEKRITAQWRLPKKNVFRPQEKSKFGIAERFSFCKYSNSAQTKISVCSIFWYWEHMANSLVILLLIAERLLPVDILERWPQVCCVKITFTLLQTNRFVSTKTNLMKCLVNWIPMRIYVPSRNTQPHLRSSLSLCRVKSTFELQLNDCFVCTKANLMKCFVNFELDFIAYTRSFEPNPALPSFVSLALSTM